MSNPTVTDLIPDPANTNRHTERGTGITRKSVQKFGPRKPIELDKNGVIIDGNSRQEIYADVDLTKLTIVDHTPGEVIAIRYPDMDLSDPTNPAREYQVAQARAAHLSLDFDPAMMEFHAGEGVDFGDWFFDWELEGILAGEGEAVEEKDAPPQNSRADELQEIWQVQTGQLWRLPSRTAGHEHRLICGDCTDGAVVERVMGGEKADMMFTDPPFAIYGASTGVHSDIADDNMIRPFFRDFFKATIPLMRQWGHMYVCCDWRTYALIWTIAHDQKLKGKTAIVWDKGGGGLGAYYQSQHELIILFSREPSQAVGTSRRTGARTINGTGNIWRLGRMTEPVSEGHRAMKPVEMFEIGIKNSSDEGGVVLEPFAGGGTCAIAAENLSRQARLIEISPAYCAVILDRYERAFGIRGELVA